MHRSRGERARLEVLVERRQLAEPPVHAHLDALGCAIGGGFNQSAVERVAPQTPGNRHNTRRPTGGFPRRSVWPGVRAHHGGDSSRSPPTTDIPPPPPPPRPPAPRSCNTPA